MNEKELKNFSSEHPMLNQILHELAVDEMPPPKLDASGNVIAADQARIATATRYVKFSK